MSSNARHFQSAICNLLFSIRGTAALIIAAVSILASASGQELVLNCATNQVGKYQKIEFTLTVTSSYTNPFNPDEVQIDLHLVTPSQKTNVLPAFWFQPYERRPASSSGSRDWLYPNGLPGWRARFAPAETGAYEAVAVLTGARHSDGLQTRPTGLRSKPVRFQCVPSGSKGFLRVSAKDPRYFELSEGQSFFAIGQNLAFIGSQQYVTLSKAEQIFGKLSENGANYLRVWTCCQDWALAVEARKSTFGRSWDWRPPIGPMPDQESSGRKFLKLSPEKNNLKVEPSHPLAVRPSTRYLLSGKVRLDPGVTLKLEVNGKAAELDLASTQAGSWREFKHEFLSGPDQLWLGNFSLRAEGGSAWVDALSLREAAGGPELLWETDVNRSPLGYYNPFDSFMLDELLTAAERHGIYLQLCYLTRDLYMNRLKDPASPEYNQAIQDARKALRYAVARWGYSTGVAAWEYWNEQDPGLPTDQFYTALGEYLEQVDPYKHLRTTSTWGPSPKDCRHAKLDIADVHFYLRPPDKPRLADEVEAVLERTRWLREQAPAKPAHLGEFGLANEKWQLTEEMNRSRDISDFHNALWASALSGASGTAMYWWWERLDQRNPYSHYKPVSRFIADIPWTSGEVRPLTLTCSEPRLRTVGLQAGARGWLWLFNRESSWENVVVGKRTPTPVSNAQVELKELPAGAYEIQWFDTKEGVNLNSQTGRTQDGVLRITAPQFANDIACRVRRNDGL